MQVGPLDIPEEVLTALEEKRLVVFAGAGVSIPPPASLPSFPGLVEEVLGRQLEKNEKGQLDRVLGRARDQGTPVHRRAAEWLRKPGSRFNALHANLVALFGSAAALRIVTTNFDRHFEEAIKEAKDLVDVEIYNAPALPVGSSFTGLVHLHGTLGGDPEKLVLTDSDFGRAYLTEGWVGRFILELFREYTVLFVGYSYCDTVMSYLTRGLAPTFGRRRFALTKKGESEKWNLLGIQAITYDPADDHRALGEGLEQWVAYERRGFLDWSRRLQELVGRKPLALAPDERGELDFCLKNPKREKLFFQHAKDPEWLKWADKEGRLAALFSLGGDQEPLQEIALWFTKDPLGSRGKTALEIALDGTRPVGAALAGTASLQIHRALAKLSAFSQGDARRVAAWAILLIERASPDAPLDDLDFWLEHFAPQDYPQLTVQILGHLLRCKPVFRERWNPEQESDLGLVLETQPLRGLSNYWTEIRNHVAALAWPLVPVLTDILESRWRWEVNLEAKLPINDSWSRDRSWVEEPAGETGARGRRRGRTAGWLLDIGKDVLDELEASAPAKAAVVIELWLAASAPQLLQLGLYGLAKSSRWTPNKKLELVSARHLPAEFPFKIETFRVLRESYPRLTQRQRERFLKRAERLYRRQIQDRRKDPERHKSDVDEWFNVLVWLERAAPEDVAVGGAMQAVHAIYPEFQPRSHPEMDRQIGEVTTVRPESHLTSAEIARLSFSEWFEELEAARSLNRGQVGKNWVRGYLKETAKAASEDFEWGLDFAGGLLEGGHLDHEVWVELWSAWKDRAFKPGEWARLFKVLDRPSLLEAQTAGMVDLVRGRVEQKDPEASLPMLESGLRVAKKLLPLAESIPLPILSPSEDWLEQAINHPGGRIAEFVIRATGRLAGARPEEGCGIPRPCRSLLQAMIAGPGTASAMARVVLATRLHYYFWIDPDWTRERLLPLFDWDGDALRAVQVWHGFLAWGRPGAALLDALTPASVQLASHLDDLGSERELYGKFIARAAFSVPDDPLDKPWFKEFLTQAKDDDRAHFTWTLDNILESLQPEQRTKIWRSWLRRYLERRRDFPPVPEKAELGALFLLPFNLSEDLGELVEALEKLPGTGAPCDHWFSELEPAGLAGSNPDIIARLAIAWLEHSGKIESWELSGMRAVILRLGREGTDRRHLRELYEKYLEHGGWEDEELTKVVPQDPKT